MLLHNIAEASPFRTGSITKEYLSWRQMVGMAIVFQILEYVLGIPTLNLILFWVSPALLSTLQLFYFGTYLPHRRPEDGYDNPHRARSNAYSTFWSFITCYHFGYHWEHHEYPSVPWWHLPEVPQEHLTLLLLPLRVPPHLPLHLAPPPLQI